MFTNIGGKLKGVAKIVFWIGVIGSIILGVCVMFWRNIVPVVSWYGYHTGITFGSFLCGLLVMVLGIFCSWLSVIRLYAYGVIVENTDKLVAKAGETPSGEIPAKDMSFKDIAADVSSTVKGPQTKICPSCHSEIPANAQYCPRCGDDLTQK